MRATLTTLTLVCCLLVELSAADIESDNSNRIQAHSYEYYQVTRPDEIRENCHLDEMLAYGLSGDALSLGEKNEICPFITQNCCGKEDQSRIWDYWHRDRKRQEYHHRTVLLILKYIIGYGKHWRDLAEAINDNYKDKLLAKKKDGKNTSQGQGDQTDQRDKKRRSRNYVEIPVDANRYCFEASQYMLKLDFDTREKAQTYYSLINKKTEFLENARRSFYCVLCSVEGQEAIDTWPLGFTNNFKFSKDFCNSMVRHAFRATYELYNTYNEYIRNILKMLQCTTNEGTNNERNTGGSSNSDFTKNRPPKDLDRVERDLIENPLNNVSSFRFETCNFTDKYFNTALCLFFCGKFHMAKPTTVLDLDIERLHAVYERLLPYESTLIRSDVNFFNHDSARLKMDIEDNFRLRDRSNRFFKTIVQHIDIANYITNFWLGTGIDPMEVARGNMLPMNYKSAQLLAVIVGALTMGVLYRG